MRLPRKNDGVTASTGSRLTRALPAVSGFVAVASASRSFAVSNAAFADEIAAEKNEPATMVASATFSNCFGPKRNPRQRVD